MLSFFRIMWQVALFQRGPAEVPHSQALCVLALGWTAVLSTLLTIVRQDDFAQYAQAYLISVVLNVFLIFWILGFARKRERFLQTLTTVFGVACVLLVVQLIIALVTAGGDTDPLTVGLLQLVFFWSLLIDAFILSRALDIHFLLGGIISIGLMLIQLSALQPLAGTS